MKILYSSLGLLLLCVVLYFSGPRPEFIPFDNQPIIKNFPLDQLDSLIAEREAATPGLKPNNEARIVWLDSIRQTEYALVYIHGFSASEREGAPIHENFAKRYGCNLLLARLADHGIAGQESFTNIEPKEWVEDAKEAVAMGKALGKKVILMSTSTGGTLSLYLAAADPDIHSLILYSPNIDIFDQSSHLLNAPWGEHITRQIIGSDYREWDGEVSDTTKMFWTTRYRLRGLHALRELMDQSMQPTTFQQVTQPTFVSYYYENEEAQDNVVSVEAIKEMFPQLGTPDAQKRIVQNTTAKTHGIASSLWNEDWQTVQADTYSFAEEILGLRP
ncbi:MAG: alpha/beta hydrolase [Bacteroidota bacterium]